MPFGKTEFIATGSIDLLGVNTSDGWMREFNVTFSKSTDRHGNQHSNEVKSIDRLGWNGCPI